MLVSPAAREHCGMETPPPRALMEQIEQLDGFAPLASRLPVRPPVHLVGGAVRDLFLGREPRELDLVVEGDAAGLARELGGEHTLHLRFGTATVRLGAHDIDLATARRERYAQPGALPEVEPAELTDDLARRDFTVNAMAVTLNGDRAGELAAVPRAVEDLEAGRLRVLHDESFRDDPTRLLRMARYAARLGFRPEAHTAVLAEQARDAGALATVSDERIAAELRLLATEPDPVAAFGTLRALELDQAIQPGFGLGDPVLAERALGLLGADGRPELLLLGLAAGAAADPGRIWRGLSARESAVAAAVSRAGGLAADLTRAGPASEIVEAVGDSPPEAVAAAGALGPEAAARRWLRELRQVRSEITGGDLLAAGVPPGPAIGIGLRAARAARLDGRVRDREEELAEALRAAKGHR
jgi:tRNA nucleotidyltransferase (CCA-adding enzyme)